MSTIENPTGATAVASPLPATLRLGPVHLTVSDLDRSIRFYERSLGLRLQRREGDTAALGAGGEDLVLLVEEPGAQPAGRYAGLYHFALLFPSREDLAHAVLRLAETRTRIEGASDHGVSEAIYLRDPDDNGIELYADRPREAWPAPRAPGERVAMYTVALDMTSLLDTVATTTPHPHPGPGPGLRMGHTHLHVADIDRALAFYRDVLGFEVMANLGSAAFVSAGGYHHHLGFNVWLGKNIGPRPDGTAGLRYWVIVLQRPEEVEAVRERVRAAGLRDDERDGGFLVRDPWGTALAVSTTPAA
jgi:catechol 2,3-dioxygenase